VIEESKIPHRTRFFVFFGPHQFEIDSATTRIIRHIIPSSAGISTVL